VLQVWFCKTAMRIWIVVLLICLLIGVSSSQESLLKDSTSHYLNITKSDSTLVSRDSTSSVGGVDTVVNYSSTDSIVYSLATKTMALYSNSQIKYQKMELQAARIDINWDSSTMISFGIPDSTDTTGKKQIGAPIMNDQGEIYNGRELGYNFETKRGRIQIADTKLDEGFYHGDRLKKVGQNILFVEDGRYTTCDAPDPHYYFFSPKMKVTLQDRVIAEPVYMYISGVPVFWFPVAVFPSKGGRRSGILAPAIAEDAEHGRLLRHAGYYWAINDYMDVNLVADLYTKGSWALSSNYQYNLRYYFSGGLSGEYRKMLVGDPSDKNYRKDISYNAHIQHNQEINPTTRLNVNFSFASNNSYKNTIDINRALSQDITSNATLSKSWEGTPNSMNINISRRQNLINGNINETLPAISFNHSQSYPLRFGKKSLSSSDAAWFEMIGMSYSANFVNNRAKVKQTLGGVKTQIGGIDTTKTVEKYELDRNYRLSQNASINISPKLGYFTISPSMNYSDDRSFTDNDVPTVKDSLPQLNKHHEWGRRGTFSSGIAASTKLYGIVQPGIFGVTAIRHTFSPNLSFVYSKQIIGDHLPPKQMNMNFSIGNIFEMKTKPSEEGKEDNKIQLLNLNAGISYNFSADSLRFSDLGVNFRTGISNVLDIGGGAVFDLYKLEQINPNYYNKVNKFLLTEEGRLARLKTFSISLSTSLSGEKKSSGKGTAANDTTIQKRQKSGYFGLNREEEEPDFSIPWRLSVSWDFSENKVPPNRSRSSNVRGNLEFNLTENWKFSMNGGYDFFNKEFVIPQINISRDLHCWMMNFSWVPIGPYRNYQFEIRLKAPQLQDIKITKSGSASGIY
jgi:hypothetical protein